MGSGPSYVFLSCLYSSLTHFDALFKLAVYWNKSAECLPCFAVDATWTSNPSYTAFIIARLYSAIYFRISLSPSTAYLIACFHAGFPADCHFQTILESIGLTYIESGKFTPLGVLGLKLLPARTNDLSGV